MKSSICWVAPCTAHLKAGSNIVSICLRNISLQQFRRHRHNSNVKSIVRDMFSLAALKHNQNERKHHATAVPAPRRFWPLFTMLVRFLTALCTTWNLPKSKILLGYFKPTPKYLGNGLEILIFKKHVWLGHPIETANLESGKVGNEFRGYCYGRLIDGESHCSREN